MRLTMLLIIVSTLVACAPQCRYVRAGATQRDFDQDVLRCRYDAELAVNAPSTGYRTEFGAALDVAMRQNSLMQTCMQVKGWKCIGNK